MTKSKNITTYLKRILLCVALFSSVVNFAQNYGSEWLDYSKEYFKIKDSRTGFFKVSYQQLADAGFPVDKNPQEFQLFRRGQEMAIRVIGEADGSFDSGDYILYYGKKLDGETDEVHYKGANELTNPYINLYSDTSSYFLTHSSLNPKRIATNNTEASVAREYLEKESVHTFLESYSLGNEPAPYIFHSDFVTGEGWVQWPRQKGQHPQLGLPDLSNTKTVIGYQPKLEVKFAGRNKYIHKISVVIGENNPSTHNFPDFYKYNSLTHTLDWGFDQIKDNTLTSVATVDGQGANPDVVSIVYTKYTYPIHPDVKNTTPFLFNSFDQAVPTIAVDFTNVPANSVTFDVSDEHNLTQLFQSPSNQIILNHLDQGDKSYVLLTPNDYLTPTKIESVVTKNDALLTSPDYLIIYHKNFKQTAENFKTYRSSVAGGGYHVEIVDQDRLIDQYNHGERTPTAIRNYCRYMLATHTPTHLLLLGNANAVSIKNYAKPYYRKLPLNTSIYPNKDYVMTIGNPSSDIMFSNQIGDTKLAPRLATGRIPCYTNEEAQIYLDKVIEHESMPYDNLWRKRMLHLSGGSTENEASVILNMMNGLKNQAEETQYGAKVTTFNKNTGEAVEFINISKQVNDGVGMVTFFGHSTSFFQGLDIGAVSIDENGFRNKGKYTLLWLNGCFSTDTYNGYYRVRVRDWLFTKNRGAIGGFGHSYYGITNTLNNYSKVFYKYAFQEEGFSHKSLGEIQQKVITEFSTGKENNLYYKTHAHQFNYLGDPAIHYFTPQKPDYAVKKEALSIQAFDNKRITAQTDSFRIAIGIENFGRALNDSLSFCIERSYANEIIQYKTVKIAPIFHQDTVYYTIINTNKTTGGINTFTITIDCPNEIDELTKNNNSASIDFFIPLNGITPLYPKDFAILDKTTTDLIFQSNDLLTIANFTYEIEIDTSITFTQPLLSTTVTGDIVAKLKNYELPITTDSTTYYWRVRFTNLPSGQVPQWEMASFTYIANKTGWGQMEFDQFYNNDLRHIYKDSPTSRWEFDQTGSHVYAKSAGRNVPDFQKEASVAVDNQSIIIGGLIGLQGGCTKDGLWVVVFDGETALPYSPNPSQYGNCGKHPPIAQAFHSLHQAGQQTNLINFLDQVPKNDIVLFVAVGNHRGTNWSVAMKDKIKEFGAELIDQIPSNTHPYIFLGKKGTTTAIAEKIGATTSSIIEIDTDIQGRLTVGKIISPVIGATTEWGSYSHRFERTANDSMVVSIFGIDKEGKKNIIPLHSIDNQPIIAIDLKNDINIDASLYPFIQLEALIYDTLDNSSAQLKHWAVTSKPIPEAIINTSIVGVNNYHLSSFEEGQPLVLTYKFQNITGIDFPDFIEVEIKITGETNEVLHTRTLGLLKKQDTLTYTLTIETANWIGNNTVQVFFNPYDQLEQIYSNNILALPFEVTKDKIAPVIDVLFDKVHITDGAIVSPNPTIAISFYDNNKYNLKEDTLGLKLFLKSPCQNGGSCTYQPIYFSNNNVLSWTNQSKDIPFAIAYTPQDLADGIYYLKVEGTDQGGNPSTPYEISFEVVNQRSITNFHPFPNPFRTSCRFAFTLTGDAIPEGITIKIYTATGELVRTITKEELGHIHAGENITTYEWQGTNANGTNLANGLYIYHVEIESGDVEIKYIDSPTDKYKQGIGKIMIMK